MSPNAGFSRRGWLLFGAMALLWGVPFLFISVAVESFSPPAIVAGRTLIAALLLLPFAIAVWAVVATGIDQLAASRPAGFAEALAWLPVIIFYGSLAALLFGAVPLFVLEYFACRRYLRRQAVPSPDHA